MIRRIAIICISSILFIIIAAIYILINSNPYKMKAFSRRLLAKENINQKTEESEAFKDFLKPSPLITAKRIHSGNLKVPLSKAMNLKHPVCKGMEDKEIIVPIFAYLIHHEKYGYYLIDSGCESSYITNPYGTMKGLLAQHVMAETVLKPEEAIEKQLGATRSKLRGVFFTHLHFDHTSGLRGLPDELLYIAGKGESTHFIKGLLEPNHFKEKDTIYSMDFDSEEAETLPIGKAIDIFGDQTLYAISTPGHSKGHVSYLVNTKDYPILITGDACNIYQSIELGVGPSASAKDAKVAQESFERLINFAKEHPETELWLGHDFTELNDLKPQ